MAKINSTATPRGERKEGFVATIARDVRKSMPGFSAAQCLEVGERLFYLLMNPHLNPLRAKAVAAGLL